MWLVTPSPSRSNRVDHRAVYDRCVGREYDLHQPDQESKYQKRNDAGCDDHHSQRLEQIIQERGNFIDRIRCDRRQLIEKALI